MASAGCSDCRLMVKVVGRNQGNQHRGIKHYSGHIWLRSLARSNPSYRLPAAPMSSLNGCASLANGLMMMRPSFISKLTEAPVSNPDARTISTGSVSWFFELSLLVDVLPLRTRRFTGVVDFLVFTLVAIGKD